MIGRTSGGCDARNLRKDHYRETRSNRPQLFTRVHITMLLWLAGNQPFVPAGGPTKTSFINEVRVNS